MKKAVLPVVLLALACGGDIPEPEVPERPIPPPTGPHAIGMTEYRWTVKGRPEPFTKDPDDFRSVAVRVWYPTDDSSEPGAMYLPDMAEFGDGEDFHTVTHVRGNAIQNAAPVPGPFPVLVYRHGGVGRASPAPLPPGSWPATATWSSRSATTASTRRYGCPAARPIRWPSSTAT